MGIFDKIIRNKEMEQIAATGNFEEFLARARELLAKEYYFAEKRINEAEERERQLKIREEDLNNKMERIEELAEDAKEKVAKAAEELKAKKKEFDDFVFYAENEKKRLQSEIENYKNMKEAAQKEYEVAKGSAEYAKGIIEKAGEMLKSVAEKENQIKEREQQIEEKAANFRKIVGDFNVIREPALVEEMEENDENSYKVVFNANARGQKILAILPKKEIDRLDLQVDDYVVIEYKAIDKKFIRIAGYFDKIEEPEVKEQKKPEENKPEQTEKKPEQTDKKEEKKNQLPPNFKVANIPPKASGVVV